MHRLTGGLKAQDIRASEGRNASGPRSRMVLAQTEHREAYTKGVAHPGSAAAPGRTVGGRSNAAAVRALPGHAPRNIEARGNILGTDRGFSWTSHKTVVRPLFFSFLPFYAIFANLCV
jgi:hypothetical protein